MADIEPNEIDAMIDGLVGRLDSLLEGEQAAIGLVACGQRAVGPVARFLLEGRPRGIYQPRRWAVGALAGLGAKDVLLEYLGRDEPIPDAVVRAGEEAVQNAAAAALARWPGDDVRDLLTRLVARRHLAGAVVALGDVGHTAAVPHIVAALVDAYTDSRPAVESAIAARTGARADRRGFDAVLATLYRAKRAATGRGERFGARASLARQHGGVRANG